MKAVTALPLITMVLAQLAVHAPTAQAQTSTPHRPPQAQCPAVRDIDLRVLARRQAAGDPADLARARSEQDAMLARAIPPSSAPHQPGAAPPVLIRAYVPGGFGGGSDARVSVWKDESGQWWFWRRSVGLTPPPPPPPPPPEGSPDREAYFANPPRPMTLEEYYAPITGALDPGIAQAIEALLADPCMAWDPDAWPAVLPLIRRIDGSRERICAPDGGAYFANIEVAGKPARRIIHGCINDSPTFRLLQTALLARASDQP